MVLSKDTVGVLVDMIENRLAVMQVGDREELREVLTLQRCLKELHTLAGVSGSREATDIPHRGRRRKLEAMMADYDVPASAARQTA